MSLRYFFSNFGPNSTTFILPSESFPQHVRSSLNGFCAAMGKTGAVVGSSLFKPLIAVAWRKGSQSVGGHGVMSKDFYSGACGRWIKHFPGENVRLVWILDLVCHWYVAHCAKLLLGTHTHTTEDPFYNCFACWVRVSSLGSRHQFCLHLLRRLCAAGNHYHYLLYWWQAADVGWWKCQIEFHAPCQNHMLMQPQSCQAWTGYDGKRRSPSISSWLGPRKPNMSLVFNFDQT